MKLQLSNLIFVLLNYYLLIDTLNGLLLRSGFISISIIYKSIILFLMIFSLKKDLKTCLPLLIILSYLPLHIIHTQSFFGAAKGLDWLFKFFSIYWMYLFFRKEIRINGLFRIIKCVKYAVFFLSINILIGLLGFGYSQYAGGIGVRGFIFAGNEMALALVTCFSLLLMYLIENEKYRWFYSFALLFVLISVLNTTKVAMVSSFSVLLLFPLIKYIKSVSFSKIPIKHLNLLLFVLLILPSIGLIGVNYALFSMGLWDRINYFYNTLNLDLLSIVLSNRNIWAAEALEGLKSSYSIIEVLFGTSYEWVRFLSTPGKGSIEIDVLDFLMIYGVLGVAIILCFWVFVFISNILNQKYNPYSGYISFMLLLILIISVTAGHVFYSGVGGPLIAMVFAMGHYKEKYIRNEIEK